MGQQVADKRTRIPSGDEFAFGLSRVRVWLVA